MNGKEIISIALIFLIGIIGFVSAEGNQATCGDGKCDAGYRLGSDIQVEDASSCFEDCGFTDWVGCDIDSISGGECVFNEKTFEFTNLKRNSCGGMSDVSLSFTAEYNGHSVNIDGLIPYAYVPLLDYVSVSIGVWPCAVATTQQKIYLKGSMDKNKFNNILQVLTKNVNLRGNNTLLIDFDYKGLSSPYENFQIINDETGEILTSSEGLGGTQGIFSTDLDPIAIKPGTYTATEKIFDETGVNLIAQQSENIVINECLADKECKDNKFWTKNICSGEKYKVCSSSINYLLIGVIILLIILFIILITFIKRK
jgi:hypothetical protein